MKPLKSNPYVYPYTPFKNLSDKSLRATFTEGKVYNTQELKQLINSLAQPTIDHTISTTNEGILEIFLDKEILFGPPEYITNYRKEWLTKISYFTSKKIPLSLTILGFPFKIPVPLKTNRTMPDMGEVLSLKKLGDISNLVQDVYPSGAKLTIFTEGIFGKFNKIEQKEYKQYKNSLDGILKKFDWNNQIKLIELEEMEKLSPNFRELFTAKVRKFDSLFIKKESRFMKKYTGALESILRIANTKVVKLSLENLMDIYNPSIPDRKLPQNLKRARREIRHLAHKMLIQYLAYLSIRDDLDFINKTVPHALALSVSPKPGRLGIIPVNPQSIRLPYHSMPVYHPSSNSFTMEYLVDILQNYKTYEKVYWTEDKENLPFFYVEKEQKA